MPTAELFSSLGLLAKPEFLDAALCNQLRQEMAAAPARPSLVAEDTADAVDENYRKTAAAQVSDATRTMVKSRFEQLRPTVARHFEVPLSGCQSPQFLRYGEGDHFRPHTDHEAEGPDYVTERRVSAVVFLNGESEDGEPDSYGGGSLTFFGLLGDPRGDAVGLPLVGEKGLLVAFQADLLHGVSAVTRGNRYTIVCWYI